MATNHEVGGSTPPGRAIITTPAGSRSKTQNAAPMTKDNRQFHGWRLIGVIMIVIFALAAVSFIVDWMVIGPLEGRVF